MCNKRTGYAISGIVSATIFFALLCSILLSTPGSLLYHINPQNIGIYGNIMIYLLTGGVFVLLFVLMSLAVKHDVFPVLNISLRAKYCVIIGCLIAVVAITNTLYKVLNCKFYRVQAFSPFELFIIAIIIVTASFVILYYEKEKFNKKWILYAIYAGIAIILGISVFTPNIFYEGGATLGRHYVDSAWNVHHASAYIDSIYNILHGQPYAGDQTDQYGHYGLFFYLPLKIFGESTLTISIILGILMALSSLCLMGAIHISVKSNYLKALTAIAGGLCLAASTANYIYWQVLPHRIIFPCLMIFVVALYAKKSILTKKEYMIGSLISILAILWNFESGIATAAAWFMFIMVKYYQDNDFNFKGFIKNLSIMVAALAVYILIPYLIVNMYNCIATGGFGSLLSVKGFIGVMLDSEYFVYLNSKWVLGYTPTEFMMFLFLACIVWALVSTSILSAKGKQSIPAIVAASTSIAGLALLTKCVNNTGGSPVEVWMFATMSLGILVSQMIWELKNIKEWKKFDLYNLVKIPACSLALIGLVMVGMHGADLDKNVGSMLNSNYDDFISFTEKIEGSGVPKDTLAVGEGTAAIYMELGWDKQYYKFYSTDDELRELFSTNDSFFILLGGIGLKNHSKFVDLDEYHLVGEPFSYNGLNYGYYERN